MPDVKEPFHAATSVVGAVERPLFADTAQASALDIAPEYVRRVEEAQRIYGEHHVQYRVYNQAWSHAAMTVAVQCGWVGVGAWVVSRGMRYSDPINSIMTRWTQNPKLRRLTTPVSSLGLVICTVTAAQLPFDIKLLRDANRALEKESTIMQEALEVRGQAICEGHRAAKDGAAKERRAFEASMET